MTLTIPFWALLIVPAIIVAVVIVFALINLIQLNRFGFFSFVALLVFLAFLLIAGLIVNQALGALGGVDWRAPLFIFDLGIFAPHFS